MDFSDFFSSVQEVCLPGIWSRGVKLARTQAVSIDSASSEEIKLRIQSPDHPVSRQVTLWTMEGDWFCDCGDRNDVCAHVAASVILLKAEPDKLQSTTKIPSKSAQVLYRFSKIKNSLYLNRWLLRPDATEDPLHESLVSHIGGTQSGRLQFTSPLAATQNDFAVDFIITQNLGQMNGHYWSKLFKALSGCSNIYFDSQSVKVSAKPYSFRAELVDEGDGFRLSIVKTSASVQVFENGAVLCEGELQSVEGKALTQSEKEVLSPPGTFFGRRDLLKLMLEILPGIQEKLKVDVLSKRLPEVKRTAPKIDLSTEKDPHSDTLLVIPTLYYGESPHRQKVNEIFIPDPVAEKSLIRKLQSELQMTPGQTVRFEGATAIDFLLRMKNWEVTGSGASHFKLTESLNAEMSVIGQTVQLLFQSRNGGPKASTRAVIDAWQSGQKYVSLLDGSWAPLPRDWLDRHGQRILQFFDAKEKAKDEKDTHGLQGLEDGQREISFYEIPHLVELCDDLQLDCPSSMRDFRELLNHVDQINSTELPKDLTIQLRHYQVTGVNWLRFLGKAKIGGLLADDMGLGKTIQALCSLEGRCLIITPTSVLKTWSSQINLFRPALTQSLYYGGSRSLDPNAQVTLTSYAILRLDREILASESWDTLVLDEAHLIKNSESQTARAAFKLKADRKIALSGTPIENHLTDLWSQFHFLNPGLLGSKEFFQENFAQPILRGDLKAAEQLRSRIKPFILRRVKKEVAPELPPRTETVLYCELSEEEREVYDSILASSRKDVVEKLETKSNVFDALELLLRLRQACCHVSLIPSQKASSSSKVNLLIETLKESIDAGHRSLVFSQWTSFLDLIEPALNANSITYLRLDGSTRNRAEIVDQFQNQNDHSVMLISLKAGGMGITLTAADHIFLMDPWWNPAIEDQAADRAHRIGQTNPVLIHRLVAQNTIEDKVLTLQKSKLALATSILQDSSQAASITRADLLELLG